MKTSVLLAALLAALARAGGPKDEARVEMKQGVKLLDRGDYAGALLHFEAAYRLFPSPKIALNMGSCHAKLGHAVAALEHYERFLREAEPQTDPALRAQAERAAAEMRTKVGEIEVRAPEGTEVRLDGEVVGRAPIAVLRAEPGAKRVVLAAPGRPDYDEIVDVGAGQRVVVMLPDSPPPAAVALAPAPDLPAISARPAPPPPPRRRKWTWIAAGAAGVLSVAAIVTFARTKSKYDDLADSCGATPEGCASGDVDGVQSGVLATNVLIGAGAAAAVGAVALWFLEPTWGSTP